MVKIRNAGALLSRESSKTASSYREIQNLNRANLETLTPLAISEDKAETAPYEDNRDTINITNERMYCLCVRLFWSFSYPIKYMMLLVSY